MIVRGCEGESWFSLGKNKFILPPGASSILARRSGYVHMLFTGGETRILLDEDHVLVVKNVFIAADVIYEWTPERDATTVMTVNAEGCIYFEASDGIDAVTLTTAEGSIEYRNKLAINRMNVHIGNVSLTIDEGDDSEENRAIVYSSVYKCSNVIETESLIPTACVNAKSSTVKTQTECGCFTCDTHSCVCERCRSNDSRANPPPSSTSSPTSDETGPRDQHFKPKSGVAALSLFVIIVVIVVVLTIGSPRRCQLNDTSEEGGIEMRAVQSMQESPAQHCESKQAVVPTQPIQEPSPPVVVTPSITTTNIQISEDDDDDYVYIVPRGRAQKGVAHSVAKRVERPFLWRSTNEEKASSLSPDLSCVTVQPATLVEVIATAERAEEKAEETTGVGSKKAEVIRSTSALINEEASEPFAEPELEEKKEEEAVAPEVSPVKLEALSKPVEEPTAAFVAAVTKLEPEAKVEEKAVNPCQG
ncbi:Hypothetical predicted protein [Cloeon dipterum]|uniref:Uncharacterized protein n=1 Tax=Cloeon dipterum TaxID=197152 RepID=A0A8S1DWR5_9INSE|nr:Hypothetical predicted protein [Cloeon dipterum]